MLTQKLLEKISRGPLKKHNGRPHFILVVPPSPQIPTPGREFFLKTPTEGVSYIATTVRNAGYDVRIADFRTRPVNIRELTRENNTVIAISTFMDSYLFLESFIKEVRKSNKDIPLVLGGSFVSSAPEILMNGLKADYAVLGEGEETILELMEAVSLGKKGHVQDIAGLCWRADGKLNFSRPRAQIRDIDSIPIPDFTLWPSVKETPKLAKLGFSSSRGCYNNCSFCFKTLPKVRQMSPERFGDSIGEIIRKHGVEFMFINDLTFVIGRKRTESLCRKLRKSGLRWACSTRVQDIDPQLLKLMKHSGCEEIWYGIESVDQKVLDLNFKRVTTSQIERAVKLTNEAGIKVMANFIVGLLGETSSSLGKMLEFVRTRNVIPCSVKYLTPFPGTHVYKFARKKGLIKNEISYFKSLSRRRVNSEKDGIINCTSLPEKKLREAFKTIREISYQRYGPLEWNAK